MYMVLTFSDLRLKDVINLTDGKNLGRVCDITVTFPENRVQGITVTGGKGFRLTKKELFIPMCDVEKIGSDAVLVKLNDKPETPDCPPKKPPCPPPKCPPPYPNDRRSYDEYE